MKNRLMQLLAKNRQSQKSYQIKTQANEATIYVYDVIMADDFADFLGGVSAPQFVKDVKDLDVETLHVRINSPGGDVFGARPMAQALREHPANVITYIDGVAASAATVVALAGDEVRMAPGGFFMIHNAWMLTMGDSEELMSDAALLEKVDGTLADDYVRKTQADRDLVVRWMKEETWFEASEALEFGFVDQVTDGSDSAIEARANWDLSAYDHAPTKSISAETVDSQDDEEPEVLPEASEQVSIEAQKVEHMKRSIAAALI